MRVVAPLRWKLTVTLLSAGVSLFMTIVLWRDWHEFSSFMHLLGPVTAVFLLVGTVEYLQRVYLFLPDSIRVRILWFWRTVELPARVGVLVTAHREVVVFDAVDGRKCLVIPRDFTRGGSLGAELTSHYSRWQRIAGEVV